MKEVRDVAVGVSIGMPEGNKVVPDNAGVLVGAGLPPSECLASWESEGEGELRPWDVEGDPLALNGWD